MPLCAKGIVGNPNFFFFGLIEKFIVQVMVGIDSRFKELSTEGIVVADRMAAKDGSSSTTKRNEQIKDTIRTTALLSLY